MFKENYKKYWLILDDEEKENTKIVFFLKGKFLKKAEKIENHILFAVKVTQAKYEIIKEILKKEENVERVESAGCPFCGIYKNCNECIWNKVYGKFCLDVFGTNSFTVFEKREYYIRVLNKHLERLKKFEEFAKESNNEN